MAAWVRAIGAWLALTLLAACGRGDDPSGAAINEVALNAIASSGPTVAEVLARGNDSVPAEPTQAGFDHLGRWAATPAMCGTAAAWRFTAGEAAAGDAAGTTPRCRVTKTVATSADAKTLTLACAADGIRTIEQWALVRHEDASMTVARTEGGNGVPRSTTLRRCG